MSVHVQSLNFLEETRQMLIELEQENFILKTRLEDQDRLKQKLFEQILQINDLLLENNDLKRRRTNE
jgi:hypothetical protein